jgi:hypothetical protein
VHQQACNADQHAGEGDQVRSIAVVAHQGGQSEVRERLGAEQVISKVTEGAEQKDGGTQKDQEWQ